MLLAWWPLLDFTVSQLLGVLACGAEEVLPSDQLKASDDGAGHTARQDRRPHDLLHFKVLSLQIFVDSGFVASAICHSGIYYFRFCYHRYFASGIVTSSGIFRDRGIAALSRRACPDPAS